MQPITPELLILVDAIARHGSFAKAARELGKVPSAVTYSIRKLEDGLDVLLFDRSGHRALLTPAGEAPQRRAVRPAIVGRPSLPRQTYRNGLGSGTAHRS